MVSTKKEEPIKKAKDNEDSPKHFKKMKMQERLQYIKQLVTIEPLICCVVIAKMICVPAMVNLHFEKACKVNAGFNDTICDAIVSGTYLELNFKEENNVVQSYLTQMKSWEVPVSSVVPCILVLFVGGFSDRHKIRKPFLLIPLLGDVVALLGTILNVIYMYDWSLEVQVISDSVIPSVFGSDKLIIVVSYAYIVDISTPKMRTVRMAVIPILINICIPIVQAFSGILFKTVGYFPILITAIILFLTAFIYGFFMIKEPKAFEGDKKELIKDIFNGQHVLETFKLLVKNNENQRSNFLSILVLCFIHATVNGGERSIFFLFVQQAYQWTVVDYSYFTTAGTIINLIGLSIGLPLFAKTLALDDLVIIIIAYFDAIVVNAIFVLYRSSIGLYLGRVVSILKPPGRAATRSVLTKFVSQDDTAKALSLNIIIAAIAATVSAQIYNQGIYEHTRRTFPQAFLLFGIAMHGVGIVILIWMYYKSKPDRNTNVEKKITDEIVPSEFEVTHI